MTVVLPDGSRIDLARISGIMEDVLFFPRKLGHESRSLSEAVCFLLEEVPMDLTKTLAKSIVLSGGNANIPGLKERVGSANARATSGK